MEWGLALTLTGLGGTFWIAALILAGVEVNRKRKCTAGASALIIGIKRRSREHSVELHPVYEYTVGNVRYTGVGAAISGRTPQVNTVVPIRYNPRRPKQSYIPGYDDRACRILAAAFAAIGSIPIIVCVCIAIFA